MTPTQIAMTNVRKEWEAPLKARIAELQTALRAAIALIRTDDHPTRQGMADNLQKTLEG